MTKLKCYKTQSSQVMSPDRYEEKNAYISRFSKLYFVIYHFVTNFIFIEHLILTIRNEEKKKKN